MYATLSKYGDIQSISFYDGSRRLFKEIDLGHAHNGLKPHVHDVDPYAISFRTEDTRALNRKEQNRLNRIIRFYTKHDVKQMAKERTV